MVTPAAMTPVAVILVAGGGTRLRPHTLHRPKALVPIAVGDTILGRAVRLLAAAGVKRLVLATGFGEEHVREAMRDAPLEVRFCRNDAWDRTQNVASLAVCAEAVGGESFFKLDGDVVFRPEVLERLDECAAPLAVAVDSRLDLGDEEMKVLADAGRITRFGKDLDPKACAGESMGIERIDASLTPRLFASIAATVASGRTDVYYEHVYDQLVRDGVEARAVPVTDLAWTEIDTPEDLAHATELVRSGRV
jgi:choline kinase